MKRVLLALAILAGSVTLIFGYSKPSTYHYDSDTILFKEFVQFSPHSWVIPKAIALLRSEGFTSEADLAQKYLLPMLEGVTFNDVWGDADLAGGSVLDYYDPDSPGTNYGYGCVLGGINFAPYKNCTGAFKSHPLYGYDNAADHAQFRYDYGKRIYLGHWGDDPRDMMAGWVIDTHAGEDDPMDGRWASGSSGIDSATSPDGTQSRFGHDKTPAAALFDLFQNYTNSQIVVQDQSEDALSRIHVPKKEVFDQAPEWLDEHFGDADDIEAYMGWDGHENAVYANWTLDAGGHCPGNSADCAAPMVIRVPVGSKAHAFFQLGWAIHLLEDNTTPVHTMNGDIETFQNHNDVEKVADAVLIQPVTIDPDPDTGEIRVMNRLPALTSEKFTALYDYPPTPSDLDGDPKCTAPQLPNPAVFYKARWWADNLPAGEGVAHAYTRSVAEISHLFVPYIKDCINTENDRNYPSMGFFTALGLDNAIKATAGLIRRFIEDVDTTPPTVTIAVPAATSYPHSAKLTLNFSATDTESGLRILTPITAKLDGKDVTNNQVITLLTDVPALGDHTLLVKGFDNAGNVGSASVTFSIVVTAASLMDDVSYFVSTGDITINNEANSLLQKLRAGAAYRAASDCKNASEVYQSFISEVQSQTGKKVSATAAAIMIADAQYLIAHCP